MITGQSVPTRCTFAHITYSGTTVTWGGSISATSTTRNARLRPRQRRRASAYATGTLETSTPSVASTEYFMVLNVQRQNGAFVNTSTKLCHANGCGHIRAESAWLFVINAVRVMKMNGARNAIDVAMSTLWFATVTSRRRRRIRAGGRRRTNGVATSAALISGPRLRAPTGAS